MRASPTMRRLALICLLPLPLSVLAAGCGGKEGTVSGTVYYKDKPVKSGTVFFFPQGKSGSYTSAIKEDGSYSVPKLPVGPAKITVMVGVATGPPASVMKGRNAANIEKALKGKMTEENKKKAEAEAKERATMPDKYGNPDKSGLTVDVKGGSQTHDIKME